MLRKFASEIMNPHAGVRLPSELGTQRTSLLAQHTNTRMSVKGETADIVLCRDSVYPLWSDHKPTGDGSSGNTPFLYSASWCSAEYDNDVYLGAGAARDTSIQMVRFCNATEGLQSAAVTAFGSVEASTGVGVPIALFPECDEYPWLYIPKNCTVVAGVSLGTIIKAGNAGVTPTITYEAAISPTIVLGDYTIELPEIVASDGNSEIKFVPEYSRAKGIWIRVKSILLSKNATGAGSQADAPWRLYATIGVVQAATADVTLTHSSGEELCDITAANNPVTVYFPMLNMSFMRSEMTGAANLVALSNRMVGVSLLIENTTSVMNIEGEMLCTCYPEGNKGTLLAPPNDSTRSLILDREKLSTRLAHPIFSFARPGREITRFQDSRFEYEQYPNNALVQMSVMNLYKVASYNLLSIRDGDATNSTTLLLTLRTVLEFQCDDVLLNPMWASGTIADLQSAVNITHGSAPFRIIARNGRGGLSGGGNGVVNYAPIGRTPASKNRNRRRSRSVPTRGNVPRVRVQRAPKPKAAVPPKKKGGLQMYLESKTQR